MNSARGELIIPWNRKLDDWLFLQPVFVTFLKQLVCKTWNLTKLRNSNPIKTAFLKSAARLYLHVLRWRDCCFCMELTVWGILLHRTNVNDYFFSLNNCVFNILACICLCCSFKIAICFPTFIQSENTHCCNFWKHILTYFRMHKSQFLSLLELHSFEFRFQRKDSRMDCLRSLT